MSRPKKFNPDEVLDLAMDVFWRKGYDNTSVQDLVDATGLNRGSLYNTFGDKSALFAEVFKHYYRHTPAAYLADKAHNTSPRQWIQDYFNALISQANSDPSHKGCFVTNTAAGLYGCDDAMAALVQQTLHDLEDVFTRVIERGQHNGQISQQTSAQNLAHFFIATAHGINVMASMNAPSDQLKGVVDNALVLLGDPHTLTKPQTSVAEADGLAFPSDPPTLY